MTARDSDEAPRAERRRERQLPRGSRPRLEDLSERPLLPRRAVAEAEVAVSQETLSRIVDGRVPKGDVLGIAELAGLMAGKRTSELIPLVHPIALTDLVVRAVPERAGCCVRVRAEAAGTGQTGVEMQALTAAAVGALAVYDTIREVEPEAFVRAARLVFASSAEGEWQRRSDDLERPSPQRATRSAGRGSRAIPHTGRDARRPAGHG